MSKKLGYLVDLATLQFGEDSAKACWVHMLPPGPFEHPQYGHVDVTPQLINDLAKSFHDNVRGIELDIDYDHKMLDTKAAGWVKDVQVRDNGLWGFIEWTEPAAKAIKAKEYKYFSAEFYDEWTHPKTKVTHKNVLFGGGITNRPFLKDILPLNLSEYLAEHNNEGSRTVDPEKLKAMAKQLGLPEDATVDQVMEAAQAKLAAPTPGDGADAGQAGEQAQQKQDDAQAQAIAASEKALEDAKKLAERNPAIKQLMELVNAQGAQLTEQAKELGEARLDKTLIKLSETATKKGYALPAVAQQSIRVLLSEPGMSRQLSEKIVSTLDKVIEVGIVELSERGQARERQDAPDAVRRFTEEIAKVQKDHQLDYAAASLKVAADQPQLFAEYQAASYAGRE